MSFTKRVFVIAFGLGVIVAATIQMFRLDVYPNMKIYEAGQLYLPTPVVFMLWPTSVGEMDMQGLPLSTYAFVLWLLNGLFWGVVVSLLAHFVPRRG